jgi:hypothetical protein
MSTPTRWPGASKRSTLFEGLAFEAGARAAGAVAAGGRATVRRVCGGAVRGPPAQGPSSWQLRTSGWPPPQPIRR